VLEVLNAATGYLKDRSVESPRLNAEHLLAHVLGVRRLDLYLSFDRPVSEKERTPLRELVRKRGERIPLQHLLGSVPFCENNFICDSRALVPRPETEQLVGLVLERLEDHPLRVLDCGTGSGVIACSLAYARPQDTVHASDSSPAALELARENAAKLKLDISFHEADLIPSNEPPFDAIVANLPYIPSEELSGLQPEVTHDPVSALDGGPDGLTLINRLLTLAPSQLLPGGLLALEAGVGQVPQISAAATNFRDIEHLTDYQSTLRFFIARNG